MHFAIAALILAGCSGPPAPAVPVALPHPPASTGAGSPRLAPDGDGALLAWFEPGPAGDRLRVAGYGSDGWGEAHTVVEGREFFVNWADVPSVTRAADGSLLAHWAEKSAPDTYAYDVQLARSTDGGRTWAPLGTSHDDGTPTEHGFVSAVAEPGGIRLFWLDGRRMVDDGPMTLRTAVVGDGVSQPAEIDPRTCECCATDATATAAGPVVVYRGRGEDEIRDVWLAREDGGRWSRTRVHADGWVMPGCPVNGPAVAASGKRVVVAWYTAPGDEARVRVAFSNDGGRTFGPPAEVAGPDTLGRVDVVLDDSGHALVVWLEARHEGAAWMGRRVRGDRLGEPVELARTSRARASGVPTLARAGDAVVLVWADPGAETLRALGM